MIASSPTILAADAARTSVWSYSLQQQASGTGLVVYISEIDRPIRSIYSAAYLQLQD